MKDTAKLCKDCVHYRWSLLSPISGRFARCAAPATMRGDSLVMGAARNYCGIERLLGQCGKDATLFEPKPCPWGLLRGDTEVRDAAAPSLSHDASNPKAL